MADGNRGKLFDAQLGWSHLFSLCTALAIVVGWAVTVETRLKDTSAEIKAVREGSQQREQYAREQVEQLRTDVKEINGKLDRLIERQVGGH